MKRLMLAMTMTAIFLTGATTMAETKTNQTGGKTAVATFAGGCFWCMTPPFEKLAGVSSVVCGYTGGKVPNPTYEDVCTGTTGHAEAVQVTYDPAKVSYQTLVDTFFRNIDPTQENAQFADQGTQYRTAIFYHDAEQKKIAEAARDALAKSGKFKEPIVTEITAASAFYAAEDYHQDYYKKNALRYNAYKVGSGRAGFLHRTWGDKD